MADLRTFAVVMNGKTSLWETHAQGCRDLTSRRAAEQFADEPHFREAESGQAALDSWLDGEFGTGTDKAGVERDDCTLRDVGYEGRVFPCCAKVS